jgi:hypothetical protein
MYHSRLTARMFALLGLAATIGVAALLIQLGVAVGPALTLGGFIVGVALLTAVRLRGRGAADDAPLMATGIVMLGIAAISATIMGKEVWPTANGLLLFVGAVLVEVLLWRVVIAPLTQGVVNSRLANERRELAARHGWHFEPENADLPSLLGPTQRLVSHLAGRVIPVDAPVPDNARARDVITGTASGVEFTALDLLVPRRLRAPKVSTAAIVRLPHALPPLTSTEVLRHAGVKVTQSGGATDGNDAAHATDHTAQATAALAADLLSDEVVVVTRERLPSWWINGSILASATHPGQRAEAVTLVANAQAIAWLATVLGSPELARHAVQATGAYDARSPY